MDNEKTMILKELFDTSIYDDAIMNEGWATEHTDKMSALVARAKDLSSKLDDRESSKFKNEFNKQLDKFNDAVNKNENIRNLEEQLLKAGAIFNKFNKKV